MKSSSLCLACLLFPALAGSVSAQNWAPKKLPPGTIVKFHGSIDYGDGSTDEMEASIKIVNSSVFRQGSQRGTYSYTRMGPNKASLTHHYFDSHSGDFYEETSAGTFTMTSADTADFVLYGSYVETEDGEFDSDSVYATGTLTFTWGGIVESGQDPEVSPLADVHVQSGQAVPPVAFSLDGGDVDHFSLHASSSNSSLVAQEGLSFSGTGAQRTLIITPRPGVTGSSLLTIAASDDGISSSTSFIFSVAADAPAGGSDDFSSPAKDPTKWGNDVLAASAGQFTLDGQALNYTSKSIGEGEIYRPWILTEASYDQNWEITLETTDTTVPDSGAETSLGLEIFSDSRYSHSLFVTAGAMNYGALQRGAVSGRSNALNYVEWEDVYLATPSPQRTLRVRFDAQTKILTSYCDLDGAANGQSWVPMLSLKIDAPPGTAGNQLSEQWGMSGSQSFILAIAGYSYRVKVEPGQLSADNFRIHGWSQTSGFEDWRQNVFIDPLHPDAHPEADADGDGIPNLTEYAFGLDPLTPDHATATGAEVGSLPVHKIAGTGSARSVETSFVRRKALTLPGLTWTVEHAVDPAGPWIPSTSGESVSDLDEIWERVKVTDSFGPGAPGSFVRVRVAAE